MKVGEIMSKHVQLVKPHDSLHETAKKMKEKDLGCVFVEEQDRLVGVVTDRDIVVRGISEHKNLESLKIKDVMTQKVLYCYEEDSVESVAQNMAKNQVRRLPVLNKDKRLVGVISIGNISHHSIKDAGEALKEICKKS